MKWLDAEPVCIGCGKGWLKWFLSANGIWCAVCVVAGIAGAKDHWIKEAKGKIEL